MGLNLFLYNLFLCDVDNIALSKEINCKPPIDINRLTAISRLLGLLTWIMMVYKS